MEYSLAKELKEAGFPKDGFEYEESIPEVQVAPGVSIPGEAPRWRNLPTLSELIEACGEGFESLCRVPDGELLEGNTGTPLGVMWRSYPSDDTYYKELGGDCVKDCCGGYLGKTPEEAVARLWLALNKK